MLVINQISGSFERSHNTHSIDTFLTDVIFTNSHFFYLRMVKLNGSNSQEVNFRSILGQSDVVKSRLSIHVIENDLHDGHPNCNTWRI